MKRTLKYPLIISLAFILVMIINNRIDKYQTYSYYRNVKNVAEPIRKEIRNNDFLSDEAEAGTFVINIWATWCVPCQKEIPSLNKLLNKYENEDILFLSVTDQNEDDVLDWIDLQKYESEYFQFYEGRRLMNYLYTLNPDLSIKKGRYPELLPTNIIIHNGEVLFFKQGYSEENITKMDSVLNELY
jgi:thiol-disulfide isomerase/thioredoxin